MLMSSDMSSMGGESNSIARWMDGCRSMSR
uniref:Uncharacterized protein n=1 Tax=Oryza glumipatula TaxID=40148 RepID=A0A0D9ZGF7_9ORYZ